MVKAAPLRELEILLGHHFERKDLLELALTHSSVAYERAAEHGGQKSSNGATGSAREDNEQLEFLGDAVIGLAVTEVLYRRFPAWGEGQLTRMRAHLVSRKHLGQVGRELGLGDALRLGRGEERSGGRRKPALEANALEAVVAAMYLDGGFAPVERLVQTRVLGPHLDLLAEEMKAGGAAGDYKSLLQEHLQAEGSGQPRYIVAGESGPDHNKQFIVEVHALLRGGKSEKLAEAAGRTKKSAEQESARLAYLNLQQRVSIQEEEPA